MSYPKKLPKQFTFVELDYVLQLRAADGTILPEGATDEGAVEVFDIVISTETAVRRPWGMETLSHVAGAIDMSYAKRGLSFLLEHGGANAPYKVDPGLHVGIVENVRLGDDRKLRGQVRFAPTAEGMKAQAEFKAKTRPWVSVGWLPLKRPKVTKVATTPGEMDEYLIQRWQPCEVSSVSVPADFNARQGRAAENGEFTVDIEGEEPAQEGAVMKKVMGDGGVVTEVADDDPRPAIVEGARQTRSAGGGGDGGAVMAEALRTRAQEVAEIYEACAKYGLQARAKGFVDSGATLIEVRSQILDLRTTPGSPTQPPAEQLVPLAPKDARRYSVLRAIRSLVDQREGRISKIDGIEGEVHAELAKLAAEGGVQNRGGLFLPMRLFEGPMDRELRAVTMSPSSAGLGAEMVQQSRGELIDILRNRTCLVSPLGARILPGLVGNITWPRVKNEPTVQWMGVNPATGASDSAMGYGWVTSTPKTMIGTVPFPRQLINATGIDVENDVRNRLGIGHGLALDLAGIVGKGTDKEPLGILNNPDVQTYDIGSSGTPAVPTFAKLKRMTGLVSKKNVVGGQLGWLTTALMASELGATLKAAAVPGFIWEGNNEDGTMAGYKAAASGQVPENLYTSTTDHGLVFGAWDNIIFGLWGALEVIIDNVSMATQGQIRVTTFQQGDTVNQRPEAFVLGRYAKISA